jgi:hypothetical protein
MLCLPYISNAIPQAGREQKPASEPPDLYETRIELKFRNRAPKMERHRTRREQEYDAWYDDGTSEL